MLVLERTLESTIRIGSDIRIKVVDIPGRRRVRLGLEVPGGTLIWREELGMPTDLRTASATKRPLSVLIVEDDPAHARLIEKGFQRAGAVTTTTAPDGKTALRLIDEAVTHDQQQPPAHEDQGNGHGNGQRTQKTPNLIILDFRLPDLSGLDVLKAIRDNPATKSLPVVLLSGLASDENVTDCLEAGANAFLAKTDDYHQFCELVIRVAEFWRHHRG